MPHSKLLQRARVLLIALLVSGSLSLGVLSTSAQSAPEDVAKALIAAEDSNNADAAAALFAPDAVVTLADGSVDDTPDKILAWEQSLADGHFRLEAIGITVDGNQVSWTGNISLDSFRQLGIASMGGLWNLDIENGEVKTFDFKFTPDALAALTAGSTVATLVQAEATHDVDTAVAQFAPDAVVNLADGSSYNTTDGIRAWQQALADGHFRLEPVAKYVDGSTVMMWGEIALDTFRQLGIPTLGGIWKIDVGSDGKITEFDFSFTPSALAALQAASAATATPEATASS